MTWECTSCGAWGIVGSPDECPFCATDDSPGHGGAGQTAAGESQGAGSPVADGRADGEGDHGHTDAPGNRGTAIDPYERILLGGGGVRYRRRPDPIGKLLREAGREIDEMLEDEDPGYQARVRDRLFGGGGT